MPRPTEADPRVHVVAFRLTATEALAAREKAAEAGQPVAAFARDLVLAGAGKRPKARRGKVERPLEPATFHLLRALGAELNRQGVNLNQIAHRMNALDHPPPPELGSLSASIESLVGQIRAAINQAMPQP